MYTSSLQNCKVVIFDKVKNPLSNEHIRLCNFSLNWNLTMQFIPLNSTQDTSCIH